MSMSVWFQTKTERKKGGLVSNQIWWKWKRLEISELNIDLNARMSPSMGFVISSIRKSFGNCHMWTDLLPVLSFSIFSCERKVENQFGDRKLTIFLLASFSRNDKRSFLWSLKLSSHISSIPPIIIYLGVKIFF